MKDLTIHRDFSDHKNNFEHRLQFVSDRELLTIIDVSYERKLKFKNDIAQGTRKERELERRQYKEEHHYGHECERCGKKIGIIPGDSDGYSLCKECREEIGTSHDFVVKEFMKRR